MSRVRDFTEDAAAVLLVLLAIKYFRSGLPWWKPEHSDRGGRGSGPGSTSTPVPQGSARLWSEPTMRLFADQMFGTAMDARLVLLAIAASSNFNADEALGNNTGLLMVRREHLAAVGYPDSPPAPAFESLDAPAQIPWIAKVLAYLIAERGGSPPTTISDLAALLHPQSSPVVEQVVRKEAERRADGARGSMLFIAQENLLRKVLARGPE